MKIKIKNKNWIKRTFYLGLRILAILKEKCLRLTNTAQSSFFCEYSISTSMKIIYEPNQITNNQTFQQQPQTLDQFITKENKTEGQNITQGFQIENSFQERPLISDGFIGGF